MTNNTDNTDPTWDEAHARWLCSCTAPMEIIDIMVVEGDTIVFYECGHGHPWARNNTLHIWKEDIEPLRGRLTNIGIEGNNIEST